MDQRLLNAANGKSQSEGGMNIPEICDLLKIKGGSRKELNILLQQFIKDLGSDNRPLKPVAKPRPKVQDPEAVLIKPVAKPRPKVQDPEAVVIKPVAKPRPKVPEHFNICDVQKPDDIEYNKNCESCPEPQVGSWRGIIDMLLHGTSRKNLKSILNSNSLKPRGVNQCNPCGFYSKEIYDKATCTDGRGIYFRVNAFGIDNISKFINLYNAVDCYICFDPSILDEYKWLYNAGDKFGFYNYYTLFENELQIAYKKHPSYYPGEIKKLSRNIYNMKGDHSEIIVVTKSIPISKILKLRFRKPITKDDIDLANRFNIPYEEYI